MPSFEIEKNAVDKMAICPNGKLKKQHGATNFVRLKACLAHRDMDEIKGSLTNKTLAKFSTLGVSVQARKTIIVY